MYKISVNKKENFEFEAKDGQLFLNNALFALDAVQLNAHTYHFIKDGKSFTAEIVKADYAAKCFTIKLNGQIYEVDAKNRLDVLLEQMGLSATTGSQLNDIKAPMPGLLLDILVTEGQTVQKGDPILILEAMKMENIIKAPGQGTVRAIKAAKGDKVEKNQLLVQF